MPSSATPPTRPNVAALKAAASTAATATASATTNATTTAPQQKRKRKNATSNGDGNSSKKKKKTGKNTSTAVPEAPTPPPRSSRSSSVPSSVEDSGDGEIDDDVEDDDDDDSEEEAAAPCTSGNPQHAKVDWSTAHLKKRHPLNKGTRHFVRTCHAYEPFAPILEWGVYYDWTVDQHQDCEMSDLERKYTDLWLSLKRLIPDLRGAITHYGVEHTASLMAVAATNARGEDAKKVKDALPLLHAWNPTLHGVRKKDRGFNHDAIAPLLCPAHDKDNISNPTIRAEYVHGKRSLDPEEWPPFMYYKHIINDDHVWRGLCKSDLGGNAGKVVFTGKSSLQTGKPSGRSAAVANSMRQMTLPAVSWVMTLTYFALSADKEFSPGGLESTFSYMKFYTKLLGSLEGTDDDRRTDLLSWWTDKLFGQMNVPVARPAGVIPSTERLLLQPSRPDDNDLDY